MISMRKDLIEDELRRPLGIWIGLLFGAAASMIAWFGVLIFTEFGGSVASLTVAAGIGAIVGGALGWFFPRSVRAIGSAFLSLLP